jgi:hypothetical protein
MTEEQSTDRDKLSAYRDEKQRPASIKILTNVAEAKTKSQHTTWVFIRRGRDQYKDRIRIVAYLSNPQMDCIASSFCEFCQYSQANN